jgi:hypothetical protein
VRVGGPHATKGLRKSRFSCAGGATARENPIFACGCLCRPHGKIKIRKKINFQKKK